MKGMARGGGKERAAFDTKARAYGWRFMREFIFPHKWVVALLILNILLRTILQLWWPLASQIMVDKVLTASSPDIRLGVTVGLVGYGILVLGQAFNYLFNRTLYQLLVFVTMRSRTRIADHLLKLSQQFYDASHVGRLLTTAIGDPSQITQAFTATMINTLAQAFVVVGSYAMLIHMNPRLTLAISVIFPLIVLNVLYLKPKLLDASERIRESWGILCGIVSEKAAAVRVVRSFAAEDAEGQRFRHRAKLHRDMNLEQNKYNALFHFWIGITIHTGYAVVFLAGGWLYLKGETTLGTVLAFYGYFNQLIPAFEQIANLPQVFANTSGSLGKVFGLLDEPVAIQDKEQAPVFDEEIREIRLEDVSFRYKPEMPWVLKDLNLVLKAGEQVGIIGPSGCGKSTLMALLLRFYDPSRGRILLNGKDLRDWNLRSLRRALGLVPQEVILFSGTVRENVLYRSDSATDEEIWQALEQAGAAEFVRQLLERLDSKVGERGVSLSGGQKQRLSIARAILTRPRLIVLDNCTSALDAETEMKIQATLREIMSGKTALIISHRVGSVTHADRILVMDQGRLIEEGSSAELLSRQGYYAAIHRQQTEASADLIEK